MHQMVVQRLISPFMNMQMRSWPISILYFLKVTRMKRKPNFAASFKWPVAVAVAATTTMKRGFAHGGKIHLLTK